MRSPKILTPIKNPIQNKDIKSSAILHPIKDLIPNQDSKSPAILNPIKDLIPNQDSKPPAILPPIKDPITNQDSTKIINKQDPILPPKYPTGYKPLFNDTYYPNKTEDNLNDSTDNSHTEIDDYLNKLNVNKDEDNDDEYKDDILQAHNSNECVIKKN